jgi:iron complex outermembrane receptor protein
MVLWVKHWYVMKNLIVSVLLLLTPVLLYSQVDTLWTANVLSKNFRSIDIKTKADSLVADLSSASAYLTKDSRFILKQYSPGSVVTSSFGGASSEQSRVLWDGIDISSMASGVLDLSLVPASMLSSSALYNGINGGAIAPMGSVGALNLTATIPEGRGTSTLFSASSIGDRGFFGHSWGNIGAVRYQTSLRSTAGTNNYPYTLGNLSGRLSGNGFNDLTYLQSFQGKLSKWNWQSNLWYTQSEKDNNGSVLTPNYINHLEDEVLRFKHALRNRSNQWQVYLSREWQAYTDTNSPWVIQDTNRYSQATLQYSYRAEEQELFITANYFSADGSNRNADSFLPHILYNLSLSKKDKVVLKGAAYQNNAHLGAHYARTTSVGDFQNQFALGTYYRLPTLNELYWNPGGNPNLDAERSYGMKYSLRREGNLRFDLTSDQLYYDKMIQWAPGASGNWSPQNYYSVYTSSTTMTLSRNWAKVNTNMNLTHQFSRVLATMNNDPAIVGKSLIYRPALQAVYTSEIKLTKGTLQLRGFYTGLRHTLRDNSAVGEISAQYWCALAYTLSGANNRWDLLLQVDNVFNNERQYYQYFPMPGRSFHINLKLNSKR